MVIACGRMLVAARSAEPGQEWLAVGALVVVGAGSLALLISARRALFLIVTSLPFAVSLLTALMFCTVAGTLILQNAQPEEYVARYGAGGSQIVRALGLDDIFHSLWFRELVGILAVTLVLVPVRNRAWRLSRLGHLGAHVGTVIVLVGALVGNMHGLKGRIDLREGQQADQLMRTDRLPPGADRLVPLGFALRLDEFEVDRYENLYRLRAYAPEGGDPASARWLPTGSWSPEEAREWTDVPSDGRFRVTVAYPDFEIGERLVDYVDDGHDHGPGQAHGHAVGSPALSVDLPGGEHADLFEHLPDRDAVAVPGAPGRLRFAWVEPAPRSAARPERHLLSLRGADGAEEIEVRPGETATLGDGWEVEVQEFLPDFSYDIETRTASSNSLQPVNPALQVELRSAAGGSTGARWLFAKHPDLALGHAAGAGGPELLYRYEAGSRAPAVEFVAVGATRELLRYERGALTERAPLDAGLQALGVVNAELHESVTIAHEPRSLSDEWRNPAVAIEYEDADTPATPVLLTAEHGRPFRLPSGAVLVFEKRSDDVKAYTSSVSVLEDGEAVAQATIRVNEPFAWKGFLFYQANYDEEDLRYSGLTIVKDPGLPIVFTGFVLMSLGVLYVYLVRPRLPARKAAA
jgi:hypothetical protein